MTTLNLFVTDIVNFDWGTGEPREYSRLLNFSMLNGLNFIGNIKLQIKHFFKY